MRGICTPHMISATYLVPPLILSRHLFLFSPTLSFSQPRRAQRAEKFLGYVQCFIVKIVKIQGIRTLKLISTTYSPRHLFWFPQTLGLSGDRLKWIPATYFRERPVGVPLIVWTCWKSQNLQNVRGVLILDFGEFWRNPKTTKITWILHEFT